MKYSSLPTAGQDEGHSMNSKPVLENCVECSDWFPEDDNALFEHERSGEKKLCSYCLSTYLLAGIEEDGKDTFRDWTFSRMDEDVKHFQAVSNSEGTKYVGNTVYEVLEQVMIKLKLI